MANRVNQLGVQLLVKDNAVTYINSVGAMILYREATNILSDQLGVLVLGRKRGYRTLCITD